MHGTLRLRAFEGIRWITERLRGLTEPRAHHLHESEGNYEVFGRADAEAWARLRIAAMDFDKWKTIA